MVIRLYLVQWHQNKYSRGIVQKPEYNSQLPSLKSWISHCIYFLVCELTNCCLNVVGCYDICSGWLVGNCLIGYLAGYIWLIFRVVGWFLADEVTQWLVSLLVDCGVLSDRLSENMIGCLSGWLTDELLTHWLIESLTGWLMSYLLTDRPTDQLTHSPTHWLGDLTACMFLATLWNDRYTGWLYVWQIVQL